MTTVLVTAVGGPAGFNIARSLLADGCFRPVGTDADGSLARLGGLGFPVEAVPRADEPGYVEAILDVVLQYGAPVLVPASDEEVSALAPHRARFAGAGAVLLCPEPGPAALCRDKWSTLRLASAAGVPVPRSAVCATPEEAAAAGLAGALVLKPRSARGARGVTYVDGPEDLAARLPEVVGRYGPPLVQERVPGGPGSVYTVAVLYDEAHLLRASMVLRKLREVPPTGGVATAGETVDREDLRALGIRAVEAVGPWTGLAAVEFKLREGDGRPFLMEINPRAFGYNGLATAAGINFAALGARAALGDDFPEVRHYRAGVTFVRLADDRIVQPDGLPPGRLPLVGGPAVGNGSTPEAAVVAAAGAGRPARGGRRGERR